MSRCLFIGPAQPKKHEAVILAGRARTGGAAGHRAFEQVFDWHGTGAVTQFGRAGLQQFDERFSSVGQSRHSVTRHHGTRRGGRQRLPDTLDRQGHTRDGRVLEGRVDEAKGDPGNTLSREELTAKAPQLALTTAAPPRRRWTRLWNIARWPRMGRLLEAK